MAFCLAHTPHAYINAGMHLARNRADPDFKRRGAVGGPRLVAFTSEQAHYSYLKAVALTGLGSDNLISVACDEGGAMCAAGVFSSSDCMLGMSSLMSALNASWVCCSDCHDIIEAVLPLCQGTAEQDVEAFREVLLSRGSHVTAGSSSGGD